MTTKTTKTTTREYDGDGKLVKETITEVTESENVSSCNCGEPIPEGRQVCPVCERKAHE